MIKPRFTRSLAKAFIYIGCIMGSLPFIGLFIDEEMPVMVPFIALGGLMVIYGFLWWWYYHKYLKWKKPALTDLDINLGLGCVKGVIGHLTYNNNVESNNLIADIGYIFFG